MIAVVVGDHHIVEDGDIRLLQYSADTVSVPGRPWSARSGRGASAGRGRHALIPREAGIHQHRLSRRRQKERGLATLGLNEIDVQSFLSLGLLLRPLRVEEWGRYEKDRD